MSRPGRHRRIVLCLALLLAVSMVALGVHVAGSESAVRSAGPGQRLGLTYGPYLGRRCAPPGRRNCERVGIDVVFRRAAARVVAVAGAQKIRLRTPGKHDGVRYRDWVGLFTHAGFPRPARGAGDTVVHAAVELRVRFADGRRVAAILPHVALLPGWG